MKLSIIGLMACTCLISNPVSAEGIFNAGFIELGEADDIRIASLGLTQPLSFKPFKFERWQTSTQVDYRLSRYLASVKAPQFDRFKNPYSIGATATLRFERPLQNSNRLFYLGVGFGGTYFSGERFKSAKDLGSKWQFNQQLEAGFRFGHQLRHEIGVRFYHISNNDYASINPGMDIAKLRYAFYF